MITLVINAGGWTFNKEAVADVWFDEQRSMAMDIDHSPTEYPCANPCITGTQWLSNPMNCPTA